MAAIEIDEDRVVKQFAAIFAALLATTALAQPGGSPPNGPPANDQATSGPSATPNSGQARSQGRRPNRPPPGGVTTLPEQVNPGRPGRPSRPPPVPPVTLPAPVPPMRPPFQPNPWHRPTSSQWYWHGRWVNRIRGPAFIWPPGHPYIRRSVGEFLPPVFLQPRFFFDDVRMLGLPRAPVGFRWVRHGPDLLLVNLRTRRIVDVAWGVFFF